MKARWTSILAAWASAGIVLMLVATTGLAAGKPKATPQRSQGTRATAHRQPSPAKPKAKTAPLPAPPAPSEAAEIIYEDAPPVDLLSEPTWGGYSIDNTCGVWFELDYLLWRRQGRDLPALVTTIPNGGVLPEATILFGDEEVGDEVQPGGRLRLGMLLDACSCWSVEGSFWMLGDGDVEFLVDSGTTTTISRPFFNLTDDLQGGVVGEDAFQVAAPGVATGSLSIESHSDVLAADVTLRRPLSQSGPLMLDFMAGYLTARIDEDLLISSTSLLIATNATLDVVDSFATENQFHGGHLGFELTRVCDRWDFQLLSRVGLGNMRQTVDIAGSQTVTVGGVSDTTAGGLLAQPTNIGTYTRDVFAVAPEIGLNLRYHLTCNLELLAGYDFIWFNRVAQPGDQIDLSINPDQPPAAGEEQRPAFDFQDSDYVLHGAHVGMQWNF